MKILPAKDDSMLHELFARAAQAPLEDSLWEFWEVKEPVVVGPEGRSAGF